MILTLLNFSVSILWKDKKKENAVILCMRDLPWALWICTADTYPGIIVWINETREMPQMAFCKLLHISKLEWFIPTLSASNLVHSQNDTTSFLWTSTVKSQLSIAEGMENDTEILQMEKKCLSAVKIKKRRKKIIGNLNCVSGKQTKPKTDFSLPCCFCLLLLSLFLAYAPHLNLYKKQQGLDGHPSLVSRILVAVTCNERWWLVGLDLA